MKRLLHRKLWPERVSAFLFCLLASFAPLAIGIAGLGFSERKWVGALLVAFGVGTLVGGFAILRNRIWGAKLAAGLLGTQAVFIVAISYDKPGRLFSAFLVLCGAYYLYDHAKELGADKRGTTT